MKSNYMPKTWDTFYMIIRSALTLSELLAACGAEQLVSNVRPRVEAPLAIHIRKDQYFRIEEQQALLKFIWWTSAFGNNVCISPQLHMVLKSRPDRNHMLNHETDLLDGYKTAE